MKVRKLERLVLCILGMALVLSACKSTGQANAVPNIEDQTLIQGGSDGGEQDQLEFWEIEEFETWMEQQHKKNQERSDSHDRSFYEKGANGEYHCREWTQKDVDALYAQWQEQLAQMKQGCRFTKPIHLEEGGIIAGAFEPESYLSFGSASGRTILIMPDGSAVDLGAFDTAEEAQQAVKEYLRQQVEKGILTQSQADAIFSHSAVE